MTSGDREIRAASTATRADVYGNCWQSITSNRSLTRGRATLAPNLTAWETVQVARHPRRPVLPDYLDACVKDFCELHGDRCFGDDQAVVGGGAPVR